MAGLFDTHTHLFLEPLSRDPEGAVSRAVQAGVSRFLAASVSRENWDSCASLGSLPGVAVALGVHPWEVAGGFDGDKLRTALESSGARAVGEIGLDWHAPVERDIQRTVFVEQLRIAWEMSLPVSIHCRGAFGEMLDILGGIPVRGSMHGWSRDPELMKRFLELGLYIGFGGMITREGALRARASAVAVPTNRFLLETDSPSMGLRGASPGHSEPAHLPGILSEMAVLRDEAEDSIARWSLKNSIDLFGDPL